MKKTCFNCQNLSHSLCDPENPNYHLHYWCKQWNTFLSGDAKAGQYDYRGAFFDDLETGEAYCYMFTPKDSPTFEDAWFERNQRENIQNRTQTEE